MSEQILETLPQTDEEYRVASEQLLAEIRRMIQQMEPDRAERRRLRAESELLKAQTRRTFASMGLEL